MPRRIGRLCVSFSIRMAGCIAQSHVLGGFGEAGELALRKILSSSRSGSRMNYVQKASKNRVENGACVLAGTLVQQHLHLSWPAIQGPGVVGQNPTFGPQENVLAAIRPTAPGGRGSVSTL